MLEALLSDTHRAWELQTDGSYMRVRPPEGVDPLNSQQFLLEWYSKNTRPAGLMHAVRGTEVQHGCMCRARSLYDSRKRRPRDRARAARSAGPSVAATADERPARASVPRHASPDRSATTWNRMLRITRATAEAGGQSDGEPDGDRHQPLPRDQTRRPAEALAPSATRTPISRVR